MWLLYLFSIPNAKLLHFYQTLKLNHLYIANSIYLVNKYDLTELPRKSNPQQISLGCSFVSRLIMYLGGGIRGGSTHFPFREQTLKQYILQ